MRVLCINGEDFAREPGCPKDHPITNQVYNVIESCKCRCGCGQHMYRLAEFPGVTWAQKYFVPLSDINETELVKERELYA